MKLAIIVTALTPYRIALYQELCRAGNAVTVFSMMHHSKELREWDFSEYSFDFMHRILPGFTIPRKKWSFPLSINFGVIPSLWRLNPDLVVSSGGFSFANIAAFVYSKLSGKHFVNWCEFTLEDGSRKSYVKRLIRRVMSKNADGIMASSSDSKDAFVHYGARPDNVKVVLMPVDVEMFHDRATAFRASPDFLSQRRKFSGPIILVVGRLDDEKGYPELFEIYERLVKERPDINMLIVGSGPDRDKYENLIRKNGWNKVKFLGFLEPTQLAQHMTLADFSVFPTLNDSFGAVIAEAMAAELPVVSSVYAYATRDLIEDDVTGYRFDPKNYPAAVKIICKMLDMDPLKRKTMGRHCYEKVRLHNCRNTAQLATEYFQIISKLKAGHGKV